MRRLLNRTLLAVLASSACWAGQASALVYTATYTGTVSEGLDTTGVFGAAGRNLAGLTFSATFNVNTDLGFVTGSGPGLLEVGGYSPTSLGFPFGNPITSSSITIDGVTFNFADVTLPTIEGSDFYSNQDRIRTFDNAAIYEPGHCGLPHPQGFCATSGFDLLVHNYSQDITPTALSKQNRRMDLYAETNSRDHPFVVGSPPHYFTNVDYNLIGDLLIDDFIYTNATRQTVYSARATARLNPTALNITVSSIPEPTTWALMIGGFGLAGATLRRRDPSTGCQGANVIQRRPRSSDIASAQGS